MSAGNDIVYLKHARSGRFTQKEYYSKIISSSEKIYFHAINFPEISFENYVSLLWTVKESVYKFCKRTDADLLFSPTKIEVKKIDADEKYSAAKFENDTLCGKNFADNFWLNIEAVMNEKKVSLKSMIANDFIFSCACENPENVFWGIKKINRTDYKNQSAEVRNFLLNDLKNIYPNKKFSIEKNAGNVPSLYDETRNATPLSLTHHGHFVAYSFAG